MRDEAYVLPIKNEHFRYFNLKSIRDGFKRLERGSIDAPFYQAYKVD